MNFPKTKSCLITTSMLFLAVSVKAQIVNIPDANFKKELVSNLEINKDNNDEISVSEAEAYKGKINVSNKDISNLEGIQSFINIETLECYNNKLTNIDVSKNVLLKSFDCSNNNLTDIDVSKNAELTSFYCGTNSLINLDLSKNQKLENFGCYFNKITTLDLKSNSALKYLYCEDNSIVSLSFSDKATLNELDCGNNDLTSLNISNFTKLDYFSCYNNRFPFSEIQKLKQTYPTLTYSKGKSIFKRYIELPNYTADYGSEAQINGEKTVFTWYRNKDQVGSDYVREVSQGNFQFLKVGEYYCLMENQTFPKLILVTKNIVINKHAKTYVEFSDENFKKEMVGNSLINIDGDAEVSVIEAVVCKRHLSIVDKNISNLKGIEKFPNITGLTCSKNNIKELDLSRNVKLEKLQCSDNNLVELDVSNLTELKILDCMDNELRSLDLSKNKKFVGGVFSENRFTLSALNKIHKNYPNHGYSSKKGIFEKQVSKIGYKLDYSTEAIFDDKRTSFTWFNADNKEVDATYIKEITSGVFQFLKAGEFYCKMKNQKFTITEVITERIIIKEGVLKEQTIEFKNVPDKVQINEVITLEVSSSSGLKVDLSVLEGNATLDGNKLSFNAAGIVKIKAYQTGNNEYSEIEKTINIQVVEVSGINSALSNSVRVFPNPVIDLARIELENNELKVIRVYDFQGKLKIYKESQIGTEYLDFTELMAGLYVIEIQTSTDVMRAKVLKK